MTATMIGQGLYDAPEVARLTGVPPDRVIRWATDSTHGPAVVAATFNPMFAFRDLVSVRIAAIVHDSHVSDRELRHGVQTLRDRTGLETPLAYQHVISALATSGNSFLAALDGGDYEDIGKGAQGVFQEIVQIDLEKIAFADGGRPSRWEPVDGVAIDPEIQAGAPCLSGTRIPTNLIAELLQVEDPDDIAFDYGITIGAVEAAETFETMLAKGDGLPV